MIDVFYKLPTALIMGALVLMLALLLRQNKSATLRLWLAGYILVFLRFLLQIGYTSHGSYGPGYLALDIGVLEISGILFLTSVCPVVDDQKRRINFILTLSLPVIAYSILMAYKIGPMEWYLGCLTVITVSAIYHTRGSFSEPGGRIFTAVLVGAWLICVIEGMRGKAQAGFFAIMTITYGMTAILLLRKYRRASLGVIATAIGFISWAAIPYATYKLLRLPIGLSSRTSDVLDPRFILALGMANVPKFIVAIGMIVTVLEDEHLATESARQREKSVNAQMRRFADVTSRLLSGTEAGMLSSEIAEIIVAGGEFQSAAILLVDEQRKFHLAGQAGLSEDDILSLKAVTASSTLEAYRSLCLPENQLGANSFQVNAPGIWLPNRGNTVMVPLRSPRGNYVGIITLHHELSDIAVVAGVSLIEILASDIAVAIENGRLQSQLFQSEKLAGMGQLVAGVAHELNNPLTAVLGYTEILADKTDDVSMQHDLEIMRREALRMKRVIENLQHFSRKQKIEQGIVRIAAVVDDAIRSKESELRELQVEIVKNIESELPDLVANATLISQVFQNIFTNALDAVRHSNVKRILIEARAHGNQLHLQICDTGPGFKEVTRVFDPFYTTKEPGKGTGLGMSLCYGIVRDHGGEITASNLHPLGACISIQLPFAREVMPLPTTQASTT